MGNHRIQRLFAVVRPVVRGLGDQPVDAGRVMETRMDRVDRTRLLVGLSLGLLLLLELVALAVWWANG